MTENVTLHEAMNSDLVRQLVKNIKNYHIYREGVEPTLGELIEKVEGAMARTMNEMLQRGEL